MLRLAIGNEFFDEIIKDDCFYADKTGYIKDLIDTKNKKVKLITRPRRFGKTLTMTMLDCFFSMKHADMKPYFEKLDIGKYGNKYMDLQGQYPVIFLSLKDLRANNKQEMLQSFSLDISSIYNDFHELLKSDTMTSADKNFFTNILNITDNIGMLSKSLHNLSAYLYKKYSKKVILLIDEYDTPIQHSWLNHFYDETISFFRNFYSDTLKSNQYIEFSVLTGISRVSKESIFSGLNNLDIYSITDKRLSSLIGFTENDVLRLAKSANAEDKMPEIKSWYDGYLFGDTEIYNPWSILKYIDSGCIPISYWVNTSSNDILKQLLYRCDEKKSAEILHLYNGGSVVTTINEGTVYADIFKDTSSLYNMMLATGYLKAISVDVSENLYKVKIPNNEVRSVYKREIVYNMGHDLINTMYQLLTSLTKGDAINLHKLLQEILLKVASYHDVANEPEIFYHALMLGLTVYLQPTYSISSNRESGYGRFDLAFFPNNEISAAAPAVIMEFKKASSDGKRAMNNACKKALHQIEYSDYLAECRNRNIPHAIKYGVAFHGKAIQILLAEQ